MVDIKNAAKGNRRITAALPDGSRLTITTETGLPLHPENVLNWLVQHEPKSERAPVLVYDSTPSGTARQASAILSPLLVATDRYLAQNGLIEPPSAGHPVVLHSSGAADARFGDVADYGQYADLASALHAHRSHSDKLRRDGWARLWAHPSADWPRTLWSRGTAIFHTWIDLAELNRSGPAVTGREGAE